MAISILRGLFPTARVKAPIDPSPPLIIAQIFSITALRHSIFFYLKLPEIVIGNRVSHLWAKHCKDELLAFHKNRTTLVSRNEDDLIKIFRPPATEIVSNVWRNIFRTAENQFPFLTDVDFRAQEAVSEVFLREVQAPLLTRLNLSFTNTVRSDLDLCLQKFPLLHTLVLDHCMQVCRESVLAIAKRKNWFSLSLTRVPGVYLETLGALAAHSPQLTELNVSEHVIQQEEMKVLRDGFPSLTSLSAANPKKTDAKAISVMAFSQLRTLNLSGCPAINKDTIAALSHGCRDLTSLDVSICRQLDASVLAAIGNAFTRLSSLNLSDCPGVNKEGLEALFPRRETLTSLELANCPGVDAKCMEVLPRVSPLLAYLGIASQRKGYLVVLKALANTTPHLGNLTVINFSTSDVTKEAVRDLAVKYPSLKSLNLSYCYRIDRQIGASLREEFPHVKFIGC